VKRLRIGRRRGKGDGLALTPLEVALYPALDEGRWQVPDRFNFTRDVVEGLAEDPKRRAVTLIGKDGIIEPRTFHVIAERAARWSWLLRERGVRPGDPVLVLSGTTVDWIEIVLACLKIGAVVVPGPPTLSAETLDVRLERTGADLVVAERSTETEIERTTNRPMVLYIDDGRLLLEDAAAEAPTHDSSSREIAFVIETPGTSGNAKLVGHSNGAVFAARVAAEHWLDAGRGDAVWCPAQAGSAESIWHALIGPWSRGAELIVHDGPFDALERLDLVYRLGVTVLCQTPAEYAALAELRELARFHPPQLRRLVSTGDWLDPAVAAVFEETWGLTIHDGYGQAESNIVVANSAEAGFKHGSLGRALPGHQVAVIDEQGNELPPGVEGELAVRGRPPTLFAGYWESPEQTKQAFRGDWYATGDMASVDEDGFFWFVGRGSDVITSRGERFGPYEAERALRAHKAVAASAVVGVRDLERGGQFVRAFVVLAEGVAESEQLEAELRHEVGLTLAEHEIPREIEFVEELPSVRGGKIRRLELRERLVVGRPLWELTTPAEPEHDPWGGMLDPWPDQSEQPAPELPPEPPSADALPDYIIEPEPEAPPVEPAAEALPDYVVEPPPLELAPEPEPLPEEPEPEPEIEPEPEPEPEPLPAALVEPEPEFVIEPVVEAVVEPEPVALVEPEPEPEPEVALVPEPEPVAFVESEPEVAVAAEPEPEPIPTGVWVPVVTETAPEPAPEPVALVEPEPEPVAVVEPEIAAAPEPEPELEPAAYREVAPAAEPEARGEAAESIEPEPEPELEPEPSAYTDVAPAAEPEAPGEAAENVAPEPEPEPDPEPEPEPEPSAYTDVSPAAWPEQRGEAAQPEPPLVTAESILNPEPPPGPLPDFIVAPEEHPPEKAKPDAPAPMPTLRLSAPEPTRAEQVPDEPSIANLGLPPLTEFPSLPSLDLGIAGGSRRARCRCRCRGADGAQGPTRPPAGARAHQAGSAGSLFRRARGHRRGDGLGRSLLAPERVQPFGRRLANRGRGGGRCRGDGRLRARRRRPRRSRHGRRHVEARPHGGGTVARVTDQATVSLLRWLRRQLRQPTPLREHLEAAVENDDPAEARRLVAQIPFTEAQSRHIDGLIARWEEARGSG
jgi:acyl-coenzyme A synthetase/AMP-(fatty) acid ligase